MDALKAKRNVGSFTVEVKIEELLKAISLTEKEMENYILDEIDAFDEDENGNEIIKFYFRLK